MTAEEWRVAFDLVYKLSGFQEYYKIIILADKSECGFIHEIMHVCGVNATILDTVSEAAFWQQVMSRVPSI